MARFWAKEAVGFVGKLKAKTLGAPALVSTDYHLNILTSDSNLSNLCHPTALLELTVSNNNNNSHNMSNNDTPGETAKAVSWTLGVELGVVVVACCYSV